MDIQNVKKYMKKNRITYEELAMRSKLSISTIKKIFSGISQYPRIDTIQAIENALGIEHIEFTENEKSLGVGNYGTKLSNEEWDWIETLSELKRVKGDDAVAAVLTMIKALIEDKK